MSNTYRTTIFISICNMKNESKMKQTYIFNKSSLIPA